MATQIQKDLVKSNEQYASKFTEGHLALPPAKKYLVGSPHLQLVLHFLPPPLLTPPVTCMDARIDPKSAFGISLGDAHIIRNAGGNAKDALRSILISQHLLGTREIVLVKHTGCGMLTFTNEAAHEAVGKQGGKIEKDLDFQPFPELEEAVRADVGWLKGNEGLIGKEVSGWVYEVETGKVRQVV
ncbi:hypothetical protein B0A48_15323 [Cryoendolithus antarcticus]|uniref:Carbonic anhydrase n=1 Tax=Cryoendolithus antarcticus TaxID=1507870 RepID=A0A1V8SHZ9_9PEZI|nr:hypothetical protein B0A48_15323 [Cryoendolithus antarcticus]